MSFDVFDAEIHAIVGENGSGKTTLMNIIDVFFKPNSGKIILNGNYEQMEALRRSFYNDFFWFYRSFVRMAFSDLFEFLLSNFSCISVYNLLFSADISKKKNEASFSVIDIRLLSNTASFVNISNKIVSTIILFPKI
ncbi:MAG: ATP-binding cassette domain-containing protein [Desulfobacterales bacterium]|nr:ATP-binding cassette domain-containing protein [Desulfobacterales bacterium]